MPTACLRVFLCVLCASAVNPSLQADDKPLRLEITRDTWVSGVGQEVDFNTGGSARLKLKGVQEFSIVDFDPAPLHGKTITAAELHVKNASKEILHRVTVSSLASEWAEGTSPSYAKQKGASSFNWAMQGEKPWAWVGSDITAVCLGQGGTIWRFADATPPDKDGWQTIKVDPAVIAARVAGISHGFVLLDDVGSEYERNGEQFKWNLFPNRFIYSHEQSNGKPYFIVHVGEGKHEAPAAVKLRQRQASLPPGEAMVEIESTGEIIGYQVSWTLRSGSAEGTRSSAQGEKSVPSAQPLRGYLMPAPSQHAVIHLRDLPAKPGDTIELSVRCFDASGTPSEATSAVVHLSDARHEVTTSPSIVHPHVPPTTDLKVGGVRVGIVDALDKINNPVTAALLNHASMKETQEYLNDNHLWTAADRTVRLHAARNETVDFQIVLTGTSDAITAKLVFDDLPAPVTLSRFRYVTTKSGPFPDPLVPVDGPMSIPAKDESIPNQQAASLLAEVYIPHDAKPGIHTGTLSITAGGETLTIKVELNVWNFSLPDVLSFIPEMNCYGLPEDQELAYYRMAHAHRTNLNRLGYSWRGIPNDRCAPTWDGKQFHWEEYDKHYGPLLDGSAFKDLPRAAVPVDSFYLPLNENWPVDINKHFKGGYWADQAFDVEYEKEFTAACAAFAEHFKMKGWNRTLFEFYLNNKVYYKADQWSKSSAPWILDEPVNAQDFWALRYYGKLFHAGVDPVAGVKMAFRCDISYPQWQRDMLDGILDINICGGAFRQYHRAVMDRKTRNGEITFNYGSSNNIEDANTQPVSWCLDTWCLGGDGVLPWQTVGQAKSWKEADQLSLFYPSLPGGHEPLPSVRLKAYRRGQQDVEYLTMLSSLPGNTRDSVAAAARAALGLAGNVTKKSADDAGLVAYGELSPKKLGELRVRIGAALNAAAPAPKRAYSDWTTPHREMSTLPEIGYVR